MTVFLGTALGCGSGSNGLPDGQRGCVCAPDVQWGSVGGWNGAPLINNLERCDMFVAHRFGQASPYCEQAITACSGAITTGDVERALEHPDVQAAIVEAPVLYGHDTRPVDGTVFKIEVGRAVLEVGLPCESAECRPIPTGVDALAKLLEALTKQELAHGQCSRSFPPPR